MSKRKSVGNSFSRKRQNLYYSPLYATCVGCCCPPISKNALASTGVWVFYGGQRVYPTLPADAGGTTRAFFVSGCLPNFLQNVVVFDGDAANTIKQTSARKKIMKGVDRGGLYNEFHEKQYDAAAIDKEVARLILDDDVTNKRGIYPYFFTRKEKVLSLRAFSDAQKLAAYERQRGLCARCAKEFKIEKMEADHITPWCEGGRTISDNCQMLCKECNRRKSGK